MKITVWKNNGQGTELVADDYAYIEVDGKTVWNVDALPTNQNLCEHWWWRATDFMFCPQCGKQLSLGQTLAENCRPFRRKSA